MLIPKAPLRPEEEAHWQKTFELIDGRVFTQEDLAIVESVQSTLRFGRRDHYLGRSEHPIRLFHDAIDAAIAGP